jgi:hypothetical protein
MGIAVTAVCDTDFVEMNSYGTVSAVTSRHSLDSGLFRNAILPAAVISGPMIVDNE